MFRFEVVIYHLGSQEDEETQWARVVLTSGVIGTPLPAQKGGWRRLRSARCDLLSGTRNGVAFLHAGRTPSGAFADRQLGASDHLGLPTIDLFLSGEFIEPEGASAHYRERLRHCLAQDVVRSLWRWRRESRRSAV